jgi:3'-5' exoribonuclease
MKSPYIGDLQPNQVVTGVFLVQSKDIRQKKTGEPYLSLLLGDRTGEIDAKMWDNVADVLDTFERDDFVRVRGLMQVYQNRPQFTIHKMVRVEDREVDFADYFPCSERSPEEMFAELRGIVSGIGNPHLRALLDAFMDDEQIAAAYRAAPAAKSVHHAFLGGLIEHVLSLCKLARMTAGHYRDIDLDLLLAGVILHDVGKTRELTFDRSFGYSSEGQLLGHIVIGLRMIDEKLARLPEFPKETRTLLEHMLISHHGELEFGSPRVPLFPEALLLHHLDNLDSKMECMRAAIAHDRHASGCWTGYIAPLERVVLKKARFLEAPAPEEAGPASPPSVAPANPALTPPADRRAPQPVSGSLFGERLQEALRRE